jgi:magnesium-transporting ATPase (P-type)
MEQNKEMTAEESLSLITETLNNSRKEITRRSAKYYILWGTLLTVFSLVIYFLWRLTDKEAWNCLWFAMPVIGFLVAWLGLSKKQEERVSNDVSRITGGIWSTFGIFACAVAAFTLAYSYVSDGALELGRTIRAMVSVASLTAEIVLLFGLAESACGVALKNWAMKIAGFVTGIGGLAIYYITGANEEQLLIFTFAGLVLVATGLIIKHQYK